MPTHQSNSNFKKKSDTQLDRVKIPPHSIEAEQSVLGGLMLDTQAWDRIADRISEIDFYRHDHRLIFTVMTSLVNRSIPFDVLTISDALKSINQLENAGGEVYLFELAKNTPSAANIIAYADIVRERSVLRQLIGIANEVAETAFHPDGRSSIELLDEAERKIFQIAERGSRTQSTLKISSLLANVVQRIDVLYHSKEPITGIATGFVDLDERTSGLQRGDLVIVAGRPSMGKTGFLMNIAEYVTIKLKKPVLIFSMEMSGDSLAMRLISSLARVDQLKLRTGRIDDHDWSEISHHAVAILSEVPMYIDDTPALSPTEVRARARRLAREHKELGLIVVDYLQLMQVPGNKENRATEISEISRSLKALAKELNVPVIAASQLNRSLEQRQDRRPVMSDLRECVTEETLVMLSDGTRVPIKELVGKTPEVLAMSEAGKIISMPSEKIWCVGRKQISTIHLASGRKIQATEKHRLFTVNGWLKIADLKVGNRIAIAHQIPEPKEIKVWPDLRVALLGQLIGDGSYLSGQPMRYTTSSEENSQIVTAAVTKEFGVSIKRYKGRRNWHQLLISGNGNRWHPKGVNLWLRELGIFGQRSFEKRIPDEAFQLGNNQVALLLRHLWATDGTIYVRGENSKGGHVIHYATNSIELAADVAALLLRLGIVARIQKAQKGNYLPGYMVIITGVTAQRIFLERVGAFGPRIPQAKALSTMLLNVTGNTNVDTIPKEIFDYVRQIMRQQNISQRHMAATRGTSYGGTSHFRFSPSRNVLQEYADILNDDYLRFHCNNDLFWDRIVAIEPAGEAEVYDITVPGSASWLADGIVSHNSGAIEQDADLIMFIYRDVVYNKEADKTKAEIIIAKQRNGPIGSIDLNFNGEYILFSNRDKTHSDYDQAMPIRLEQKARQNTDNFSDNRDKAIEHISFDD